MAEIKSPLGARKITNSNMKQFEVPDDSFDSNVETSIPNTNTRKPDFLSGMESIKRTEELHEQRRRAIAGKERLDPGALERIGLLLGTTQTTREVDLGDGIVFILKSLKTSELRDVITYANKVPQLETAFEMRRQYLSRTIKSISGIPFENFIASNELDAKLHFIDEMDDSLANRLYDEFIILKDSAKSKFQIKTEEEAREVLADLKKS